MDEGAFVEQKKESWEKLSEALDSVRLKGAKSLSREQLRSFGASYRALVSDLSFARTQGASEGLQTYLNELAGRAHGVVYAAKSTPLGGITSFVFRDFPALFRHTINYTLVAAMIFFVGWAISATSPEVRDSFVPQEVTKPAKDESPLAGVDPSLLSSFIVTNNIKVGIMAFAGGITAGVYTIFELARNGLAIGAVATKAAPVMGQVRFWSYILPHGIIELTAIFICGGAGLMIGAAIIAPGNLRRRDSVRLAAAKALRLFAGAVLFFVVAGTIEGFITPSRLPAFFKLSFAGFTAIALLLYLGFAGRGSTTEQCS